MKERNELIVSASPHLKSDETVRSVMVDVLVALIPALVAAVYFFGIRSLLVIIVCVGSAVLTEHLCLRMRGKPTAISDFSAIVTGILLAFCLPPGIPFVLAAVGAAVSIGLGKQAFGGLGHNIFNPALVGRAFMLTSWPVAMTSWAAPLGLMSRGWLYTGGKTWDAVTTATPLDVLKESVSVHEGVAAVVSGDAVLTGGVSMMDMFIGRMPGSIGETSALALLLGGIYLLYRGQITWHIPFSYVGVYALLTWIWGGGAGAGLFSGPVAFNVLSGGLLLGAFFMITDMVTSPVTPLGRIIFGAGGGVILFMIRMFGGYPEGVCYSILLMNACAPLIDRFTRPRRYGEVR